MTRRIDATSFPTLPTGAFDTTVAKQGVGASPIWVMFVFNVLKRTPENSVNANFAEFPFRNCLKSLDRL